MRAGIRAQMDTGRMSGGNETLLGTTYRSSLEDLTVITSYKSHLVETD